MALAPARGAASRDDVWTHRIMAVIVAVSLLGYFVVSGKYLDPNVGRTLDIPLDHRIPFWPPSVFVYVSIHLMLFFPILQVRDASRFKRISLTFCAYNLLGVAWVSYRFSIVPAIPAHAPRGSLTYPRWYLLAVPGAYALILSCLAVLYWLGFKPF